MKRSLFVLAIAFACASSVLAQSRFGFQERETIRRSLDLSLGAGRALEVDNIDGSIRVSGYGGSAVEMTVMKSIRAESPEQLEVAKREVQLEITNNAGGVRLYVNHPGRCKSRGSGNCFDSHNETYRVQFDFDIRVPSDAAIKLQTINGGEINVEKVAGDFDVNNVNGGVEMRELGGSGRAYALNGKMKVTFASNPRNPSYFGSLNGNVEVSFQPGLSADLRFKTFNGSVFSDFPVEPLASPIATTQGRNGKIYDKDQFQSARVGRGGPELTFDGFNGTIRILEGR
jgi:DUF4097 and DUF4098 domain-containing protein YvlB